MNHLLDSANKIKSFQLKKSTLYRVQTNNTTYIGTQKIHNLLYQGFQKLNLKVKPFLENSPSSFNLSSFGLKKLERK